MDPVQPIRDERLQYQISKLQSQGRASYLSTAEQIVDPYSISSTLGAGGVESLSLQECAFDACVRHVLRLLSSKEDRLVSLHLSENNGEFIERIGQWCQQMSIAEHHWLATPLRSALAPHIVCDHRGTVIPARDLRDCVDVDLVLTQCREQSQLISIITADCELSAEHQHGTLFVNQVLIALELLRAGGIFVVKIGEFYQHNTKLILWLLFSVFERVEVKKPLATPVCDTTKYVVCHQYKQSHYEQKFKSLCVNIRSRDNPSLLEFPLSWSYWLTDKQNQFNRIKESYQTKAMQIAQLLLHKTPYLSETSLHDLLETCWLDKNVRKFAQRYILETTNKQIPVNIL